ncbi:MAG: hypothetical protein OXH69_16520, partial [Acidobacteria bacterium]|nr:hypothetical protein [Acidobacteriota bacterium]
MHLGRVATIARLHPRRRTDLSRVPRRVGNVPGIEGEPSETPKTLDEAVFRPLTTFPKRPFTLTMSVALMMTRPPTRCMSSCTSVNLTGEKGGTPMSSPDVALTIR